ncbi:MAG: hypothetical protein KJ856_12310 [Gammaproteobacteria bacterium]|nr:hypothetical protein [Gammaproteobacteria bacterium]MBU1476698.1 hypothetical protein [Gammaproteobacteria bacterium]MBU1999930.1 hypothetical protein [Gammaproteobacteria bacterium]MBU2133742.1 hypothetical protein [Gammaproteobacteria bacterium]MBU2187781.1 hypothetical protein [Gammaproteobacteria bacterium]
MMANKEMNNLLDDIMIEHIANAQVSELMAEYKLTSDEIQTTQARLLHRVKECKQQYKKARLTEARAKLEAEKTRYEDVDVEGFLAKLGKDAKDVLIELFMQNRLPENLTVAHREGKEYTDEDAKQIIANLIAMGAIDVDNKGN